MTFQEHDLVKLIDMPSNGPTRGLRLGAIYRVTRSKEYGPSDTVVIIEPLSGRLNGNASYMIREHRIEKL